MAMIATVLAAVLRLRRAAASGSTLRHHRWHKAGRRARAAKNAASAQRPGEGLQDQPGANAYRRV